MRNKTIIVFLCSVLICPLVSCTSETVPTDPDPITQPDSQPPEALSEEQIIMQDNKELLRTKLAEIDVVDSTREDQLELLCYTLESFGIGRIQEVTIVPAENATYAVTIKDDLGFDYDGHVNMIGGVGAFDQAKDGDVVWTVIPVGDDAVGRSVP